jgi:hypothetical protein
MGSDQQKVEVRLFVDKDETIAKILCARTAVCLQDAEVLNGEARYLAKARFEIVYLSQNGNVNVINDTVDFNGRLQDPLFNTTMYALVNAQVVDAQINDVKPDSVTLSSIIDTLIDVIVTEDVKYLEDGGDRIVVRKEKFCYCTLASKNKSTFKVVEEYETKENMGKLLLATVNICNQEVICGTNYITIKGTINLNLTYETDGEEKEIKSSLKTFKYSEEIEAEGVMPGSAINLILKVKEDEVSVFGNNIDGSTVLKISVGMCYNYAALNTEYIDAVTDAFSLDNNINLIAESFDKCKFVIPAIYSHIVTTSAVIDEEEQIESIEANCGGTAFVANSYTIDNYVVAEGIVNTNIIYYTFNEAEELMYNSLAVQVPYSIEIPLDAATKNSSSMVFVGVKDMQVRRKRGKEIELQVELCAFTQVYENEQEMVVSNIEFVGNNMVDENSLKMYAVSKDSTLWDVCKRTMAEPERIMEQNKELEFPLKEDTIIVIYKPKEEIF